MKTTICCDILENSIIWLWLVKLFIW